MRLDPGTSRHVETAICIDRDVERVGVRVVVWVKLQWDEDHAPSRHSRLAHYRVPGCGARWLTVGSGVATSEAEKSISRKSSGSGGMARLSGRV